MKSSKYSNASIVKRMSLIGLILSQLPACATVVRGTTEPVNIISDPSGALVELDNGMQCVAPCQLELPRKHAIQLKATLDCYKDATAALKPQVSGAGGVGMAGNAIIGGVVGIAVDAVSGAAMDLKPNPLYIKLEEDPMCQQAPKRNPYINVSS